jgi:D-alanyl-D-alanine carboxypeptidase
MGLYLRSIAKNNNPDQNGTAKPTYSEHQLGTTVDLTSKQAGYRLTQDFEKTKAFKWLKENMAKFNMVLSFPRNNSQGYIYEPWHIRYVGKRLN